MDEFEPISSYGYTKTITILQNNPLMKKDRDLPEESTMKNIRGTTIRWVREVGVWYNQVSYPQVSDP